MSDTNTLRGQLEALAKLQAEQRAKAKGIGAIAIAAPARNVDAFGSPLGTGTSRMHAVLAEAWAMGLGLSRRDLATLADYTNIDNHLRTMHIKGRVSNDLGKGSWRLTEAAAAAWHGEGKPFGFAVQPAPEPQPEAIKSPETNDQPGEVPQPEQELIAQQSESQTPKKGKGKKAE